MIRYFDIHNNEICPETDEDYLKIHSISNVQWWDIEEMEKLYPQQPSGDIYGWFSG